jgi:hypothetical protein
MNHRQRKPPLPITHHPAWRHAIQQLEEAIEQNSEHSNAERIQLIRTAYFADVDAMPEITLPKRMT